MAKPYSMDLRERAMRRVAAGESAHSVAAVLKVSVSSIIKWAQRQRRTGSVAPGKMGGRGFWREAQQVQEKRIWASLPSSLRIAWKGVLKPRHFLGVRLAVMTMSWISASDRRSMSM